MNEMKPRYEAINAPPETQEDLRSAVTHALEQAPVHEASKARLRVRIQEIQRTHPELIFPMQEQELEGFVHAFQHNCINGSCLPEDVEDMILENLSLLKRARERRKGKQAAA